MIFEIFEDVSSKGNGAAEEKVSIENHEFENHDEIKFS